MSVSGGPVASGQEDGAIEFFQDCGSEGQNASADRANQFKTHCCVTSPAKRKTALHEQRGFVHQTVGFVLYTVNSADRHNLTRLESLLHMERLAADRPISPPETILTEGEAAAL